MTNNTGKLINKEPNSYYARIFLFFITSIVVTILILSTVLYKNFEVIAQRKIYSSEKQSLSQTSYSADILTESAKTLMMQLYGDRQIQKLLYFSNPEDMELNDAIRKLITYQSAASFVHSIYIYNPSTNLFYVSVASNSCNAYTSSLFYDEEIVDILHNYKDIKMYYPIPRDIPLPTSVDHPVYNKGYTYIFYEPSDTENNVNFAIVINISEAWLRRTVNNLDTMSGNSTFIIDRKGNTIINSGKNLSLPDISNKEYINTILKSETDTGYFVDSVDGAKSLIIYTYYNVFDWIFIRTIPYNTVMEEIVGMKNKTIIIAMLILVIGILGSFFISRYLFKPIDSMQKKLKSLESEKRNNLYILKQDFLRSILLGKNDPDLQGINDQFNALGIKFDLEGTFLIILLMIDRYSDYCIKYNPTDLSLYKFGIMNITSEIFAENFNVECVDIENSNIAVCINLTDADSLPSNEDIQQIVLRVQEGVQKFIDMTVSAVVSSTDKAVESLPSLYMEIQQASYYRLYYGYNSIIFARSTKQFSLYEYSYPSQKEKLLVEALMLGKLQELKSIFSSIIENAVNYPYASFHLTMSRVAFAVNTVVETIERSSGMFICYDFNELISKLNRCETIDEVTQLFFNLFDHIIGKLDERKDSKYDILINKIVEMINNEYMRPDLTLESIAERVNMSNVYLGRLFKKLTSTSMVDYINDLRMKKAASLLSSSNIPIASVVEQTGFTNSQYFYKMFKKTYGVTPNEYRQKTVSGI